MGRKKYLFCAYWEVTLQFFSLKTKQKTSVVVIFFPHFLAFIRWKKIRKPFIFDPARCRGDLVLSPMYVGAIRQYSEDSKTHDKLKLWC
jgi:hypothetical protein